MSFIPNEQVMEEELKDPAVRKEWQRTAPARALSLALVRYRADHDLTQRQLADILGWSQPRVATLEAGDHNPSIETLAFLSGRLNMNITITLSPADHGEKAERAEEMVDGKATAVFSFDQPEETILGNPASPEADQGLVQSLLAEEKGLSEEEAMELALEAQRVARKES